MANLGFIGLGVMGGRLAKRLLDAGHHVTGYNRTSSRAAWLVGHGLRLAASPREVVKASEVTFGMVSDAKALRAVTEGPDGTLAGLEPGRVYVEMSTVGPLAIEELAVKVAETGGDLLDAPVVGTVATLERGKLDLIMLGGEAAVCQRVRPFLDELGRTVVHVGGTGKAMLLKTGVNLSLPVQMAALAEGLLLAEKAGIPRELALQAMCASPTTSRATANRVPFLSELPEEPWFDVRMMQKDLELALERGRALGVPMPMTAAANQLLTACRGLGYEKEDFAALYYLLARLAGLDR
ncbi:MAG TPA: NAD(P)-dependent oxidoreductase [Actinomycetes bacterium]|nr:NAD(P)-dependent oxidoreductase [Actinomycetes bacterium]